MRSPTMTVLFVVVALVATTALAQDGTDGKMKEQPEKAAPALEKQPTLPLKLEKGQTYVWMVHRGGPEADVLGSEEIRPEGSKGEKSGEHEAPDVPKHVTGEKLRYEFRVTEAGKDGSTLEVKIGAPPVEPMKPMKPEKDGADGKKPEKSDGDAPAERKADRTLTVKLDAKGEIRSVTGEKGEALGPTEEVHRDYLELMLGSGLHEKQLQPGKDYEVGGTKLTLQSPGDHGMHPQVKFDIAAPEAGSDGMPGKPKDGMGMGDGKSDAKGRHPMMEDDAGEAIYDGGNGLLESFVPKRMQRGGPDFRIRRLPTTEKSKVPGKYGPMKDR